ncbi:MAG: hypothetical protein IT195_07765, partial [Microthrixaceae bacterium]|nr:hypothetical protein [Microthrixaceae bacterium]
LQSIYQSGLPSPTTQPRILGELSSVGETATADPGVWDSTTTLSYQWYRCTTAGACTLLPATGSAYVIQPGDAGHRLKLRVTATNAIASASADSVEWPAAPAVISVAAATLAEDFRPILRFDNSERWRPLNIDTFLSEVHQYGGPESTRHQVCEDRSNPGVGCVDITSWETLRQFGQSWEDQTKEDWPYIDIHGNLNEVDYASPHLDECSAPSGLYDCDSGATYTSIYWHTVGPFAESNYRYFDYWFFYRLNWFDPLFSHEGDWEGMTVAVSASDPDPATFAFAALSAHGRQWHYLRKTLICNTNEIIGGCGPGYSRVNTFIANDTHANYPQPCSAPLGIPICGQTDDSEYGQGPLPEKGYDGSEPWQANTDPAALKPFPATRGWAPGTTDPTWVDWYGLWGAWGSGVESPAAWRVPNLFNDPHLAIAAACTERFTDPNGGPYVQDCDGTEGPNAPRAQAEASIESPCDVWNGPHVVASLCQPAELRDALRTGTIDNPDGARLAGPGLNGRTYGAGTGIDQLVGKPIRPGERLRIVGPVPAGTWLRIVMRAGEKTGVGVFKLPLMQSATIVLLEGGARVIDSRGRAFRPIAAPFSEARDSQD